jgi:hypothetical protein
MEQMSTPENVDDLSAEELANLTEETQLIEEPVQQAQPVQQQAQPVAEQPEFQRWDAYRADPAYNSLSVSQKQGLFDSWREYATKYMANTGVLSTEADIDYAKNYFDKAAELDNLKKPRYEAPSYTEELIGQAQSGLNALQAGSLAYGAASGFVDTDSAARAIVERRLAERDRYINPTLQAYGQKQQGFFGSFKDMVSSPKQIIFPMLAQSLGSNLPAIGASLTAGAIGTAVGGPGVGAAAALNVGAVAGGGTDTMVNMDQLLSEEMQKRGLDPFNPADVKSVLDDTNWAIPAKAASEARGVAIGATQYATLGFGRLASTPLKVLEQQGLKGFAKEGLKQTAIQVAGEPVSEIAAQKAEMAGGRSGEIRWNEVAEELVVGLPMSAVEAGGLVIENLNRNNSPATADEVSKEAVQALRQGELAKLLSQPLSDVAASQFYDVLSLSQKAKVLGLADNAVLTEGQGIYNTLSEQEKANVQQAFNTARAKVAPEAEVTPTPEPAQVVAEEPTAVEPAPVVTPATAPEPTVAQVEEEAKKVFEEPAPPVVGVATPQQITPASAETLVRTSPATATVVAEESKAAKAEEPAPVAPTPVAETPAPVAETPAPVAEAPAPVVEQPKVEAPTPAPVQPTTPKLPRNLAGAKPRYGFGSKQFGLTFENDIDRALYIIAQATKSAKDAEYLDFVMKATGLNEAQARAAGRAIRASIKEQAKTSDADTLEVAQSDVTKPKVEAPVAVPVMAPQAVTPPAAPTPVAETPAPAPVTPALKKLPPTKKQVTALTKLGYLPADIEGLDRTQAKDIVTKQTPKTPTIEAPKEAPQATAGAPTPEAPAVAPAPVSEPAAPKAEKRATGKAGKPVAPAKVKPAPTNVSPEEGLNKTQAELQKQFDDLAAELLDMTLDEASVQEYFKGTEITPLVRQRLQALMRIITLGLSNARNDLIKKSKTGKGREKLASDFAKKVLNKVVFIKQRGGSGVYADPRNLTSLDTLFVDPSKLFQALMSNAAVDPADFFVKALQEEIIHMTDGRAMYDAFKATNPAEITQEAYEKFYDANNKEIEDSLTLEQIRDVLSAYASSLGISFDGKTKEEIVSEFNAGRPGRLGEEYVRAITQRRESGQITEDQVKKYTTRPILRTLAALRDRFLRLIGKGTKAGTRKSFIDNRSDAIVSLLANAPTNEKIAAGNETNVIIPRKDLASTLTLQELDELDVDNKLNAEIDQEVMAELAQGMGPDGLIRRLVVGGLERAFKGQIDTAFIEQAVLESLASAATGYDATKGAKPSTRVFKFASRKIIDELRKIEAGPEFVSFNDEFATTPFDLKVLSDEYDKLKATAKTSGEVSLETLKKTGEEKVKTRRARGERKGVTPEETAKGLEKEVRKAERVGTKEVPETRLGKTFGETDLTGESTAQDGTADDIESGNLARQTAIVLDPAEMAQRAEVQKLVEKANLTSFEADALAYSLVPESENEQGELVRRPRYTADTVDSILEQYSEPGKVLYPADFYRAVDSAKQKIARAMAEGGIKREELYAPKRQLAASIELDKNYSEAINSNNTLEANRLVKEAANASGYSFGPVYHGSPVKNISEFTPSRNTVNKNFFHDYGPGIYVTNDLNYAKEYTTNRGLLFDSILAGQDLTGDAGKVYNLYAKLSNPLEIKGADVVPENIYAAFRRRVEERGSPMAKEMLNDLYPAEVEGGGFSFADILSEELASFMVNTLKSLGYDGIIAEGGKEIVVWDPSQLKSADTITYDEQGKVVPLTERFNPKSRLLASSIDILTDSKALRRGIKGLDPAVAAVLSQRKIIKQTRADTLKKANDFVARIAPTGDPEDLVRAKSILDSTKGLETNERNAILSVIVTKLRDGTLAVDAQIKARGDSPELSALKKYLIDNAMYIGGQLADAYSIAGRDLGGANIAADLLYPLKSSKMYTDPIFEKQKETLGSKDEVQQLLAEIQKLKSTIAGLSAQNSFNVGERGGISIGQRPPTEAIPEGENFYKLLSVFGDMAPTEGEDFVSYLNRIGISYNDLIGSLEGIKAASVSPGGVNRVLPADLKAMSAADAIKALVKIDPNLFSKMVKLRVQAIGTSTNEELKTNFDIRKASPTARQEKVDALQGVFDFFDTVAAEQQATEKTMEEEIEAAKRAEETAIPPVVRLAKYAADTITQRVLRSLGVTKKATEKAAFDQLESQVRKIVNAQMKQELDPKKVSAEDTRTLEEMLVDIVQRITLAEEVFNQVQANLQAELNADNELVASGKESKMPEERRAYIEGMLEKKFDANATKSIDTLLRNTIDFKAESRKHMMQRGATLNSIQQLINQKFPNLREEQVVALAKVVATRYNALVKERAQKQLENITRRIGEKATAMPKSKINQLLELVNLGAFNEEKFYNAIAERYDIPEWDPVVAQEIVARANQISQLPESSDQRLTKAIELNAYIAQEIDKQRKGWEKVGKVLEVMASLWKAGVLSGPPTQLVNLGATHINVLFELTSEAKAYAQAAKRAGIKASFGDFFGQAYNAYVEAAGRLGIEEAGNALATGLTRFRSENNLELNPLEKLNKDPDKPWSLNNYAAAWKLVGRVMAAADTYNSVIANEAKARMEARYVMLKQGLTAEEATQKADEIFSRTSAGMKAIQKQVNDEESLGQFGTLAGLTPDSKEYKSQKRKIEAGKSRRFNQLRERYVVDQAGIGQDGITKMREFAQKATFNGQPKGSIGYLMDAVIGNIAGKVPILTPFAAFPRTIANIVNSAIDYTPYGWLRANGVSIGNLSGAIRDSSYKFSKPEKGSVEYYQLRSKALYGSVVMASIIGLAIKDMDKDWDEAFFAVTGRGPSDRNKREQLRATGWSENTVKIGPIRFKHTDFPGLNLLFGALATVSDAYRYEDLDEATFDNIMFTSALSIANSVVDKNLLSGAKTLFDAVSDRGDASDRAKRVLSSYTGAYLNPGIARWLSQTIPVSADGKIKVVDTKTQNATMFGWLIGQTPIAVYTGAPMLNRLGEEVRNYPWSATTKRFGFVPDVKPHPVITPLVQEGLVIPGISAASKITVFKNGVAEKRRLQGGDEFYQFSKYNGEYMGRVLTAPRAKALASLARVNKDLAQKQLNELATKANDYAKARLEASLRRTKR